jgi:hypothetical protein
MRVASVNVRYGGGRIAARAASIVRAVRDAVPSFETALLLVQECSAPAMRAIRAVVGATHAGFARRGHATAVGPFVATFVPRSDAASYSVARANAPHTTMGRDYHSIQTPVGVIYNVHLDSCADSAATRDAQVRAIATARRCAVLGDLNGPAKYAARGMDVAVTTARVPHTDHKARLYVIRGQKNSYASVSKQPSHS